MIVVKISSYELQKIPQNFNTHTTGVDKSILIDCLPQVIKSLQKTSLRKQLETDYYGEKSKIFVLIVLISWNWIKKYDIVFKNMKSLILITTGKIYIATF